MVNVNVGSSRMGDAGYTKRTCPKRAFVSGCSTLTKLYHSLHGHWGQGYTTTRSDVSDPVVPRGSYQPNMAYQQGINGSSHASRNPRGAYCR